MKLARFCLLIVLALLLPLRGALAQVLPCTGGHGEHAVHAVSHDHAAGHVHGDPAAHSAVDLAASASAADDAASTDHPGQCSACATCCTGVPLPSLVRAFVPALAPAAIKFPSWSAPVPGVVLQRLDRPPCFA